MLSFNWRSFESLTNDENNRMGKTRDLKEIRAIKGTLHAKMGTIKDHFVRYGPNRSRKY